MFNCLHMHQDMFSLVLREGLTQIFSLLDVIIVLLHVRELLFRFAEPVKSAANQWELTTKFHLQVADT